MVTDSVTNLPALNVKSLYAVLWISLSNACGLCTDVLVVGLWLIIYFLESKWGAGAALFSYKRKWIPVKFISQNPGVKITTRLSIFTLTLLLICSTYEFSHVWNSADGRNCCELGASPLRAPQRKRSSSLNTVFSVGRSRPPTQALRWAIFRPKWETGGSFLSLLRFIQELQRHSDTTEINRDGPSFFHLIDSIARAICNVCFFLLASSFASFNLIVKESLEHSSLQRSHLFLTPLTLLLPSVLFGTLVKLTTICHFYLPTY